MAYLISSTVTRIKTRIAAKEAALAILEAELLKVTSAQSYRFNDGEGSISTEYRSAHEIRNNIRILENEIDYLYQKLQGFGIVSLKLRRRG